MLIIGEPMRGSLCLSAAILFSISDLEKSVRLVPRDFETKNTLRNARAEYRKLQASVESSGNSNNAAARLPYPTNELVNILDRIISSDVKIESRH